MQRWTRLALSLSLLTFGLSSCKNQPEQAEAEVRPQVQIVQPEDEAPPYPPIDPASVTPLDVLYFDEPTGKGYQRRPIRIGKSLYSGKWLGIADGQGEFFGDKHIVVDHLRRRASNPYMGDIEKSVVLDVDTGEVVADFARYGYPRFWGRGIMVVYKEDDDRPYLLDARNPELVLVVPEGAHQYVYGKNFWLRLGEIDNDLWIQARDQQGTPHLYQWEDRQRPPELPNNPFPFLSRDSEWEPGDGHNEIRPRNDACGLAILTPPKRWECLPDLEHTRAMSDGWRLDYKEKWVVNMHDGRGFDLTSLCPPEYPAFASVINRDPPRVEIACDGDPSVWLVWSPPDRVQRLSPELAVRLNRAELWSLFHHRIDRFGLSEHDPKGARTAFDYEKMTWELVGSDYFCDLVYRSGNWSFSGIGCRGKSGHKLWFELADVNRKLRSRFSATELAVSGNGVAVGIVRRGNRDHVVRLSF